jgi:hypothetical protein
MLIGTPVSLVRRVGGFGLRLLAFGEPALSQ